MVTIFGLVFSILIAISNANFDTSYDTVFREKRAATIPKYYKLENGDKFNMHEVHNYEEIVRFMRVLERENPKFIKIVNVGRTSERRNIKGIRISSSLATFGKSKDVFWIDAGIHAREWNTPMTATILVAQILQAMKQYPESSISQLDWIIVPVMNPDGYIYSATNKNSRMWRKNRSNCPCTSPTSCGNRQCCGVDLNRNFDATYKVPQFHYGNYDKGICGDIYSGKDPRGEPETRTLISSLSKIKRLRAYVTLHDSGQYFMYPYARTSRTYPKNIEDLRTLAKHITSQIEKETGRVYKTGSAPELLYEAPGTSGDWAADRGVEFVYSVELPPKIPAGFRLDTLYGKNTWMSWKKMLPAAGQDMWIAVHKIAQKMVKYARFQKMA